MQNGYVLFQNVIRSCISGIDYLSDLGIDNCGDFVGVAGLSLIISADEHFLFAAVVDVGQGRGHTPFGDHAARHGSRLFDILRSAGSNILYYQRFCGSAAHRHCDSVLQMRQSHVRIVGFRT